MPLAIIQRVFGTTTRSSGFWTPQTNESPPRGVHGGACGAPSENEPQIAAHTSNVAKTMFFMIVSGGIVNPAGLNGKTRECPHKLDPGGSTKQDPPYAVPLQCREGPRLWTRR